MLDPIVAFGARTKGKVLKGARYEGPVYEG